MPNQKGITVILLVIIIVVASLIISHKSDIEKQLLTVDVQKFNFVKPTPILPSPAPTLAPTPTPKPAIYIPAQSGRSVRVPILMYHYIGNSPKEQNRQTLEVAPEKLEEQMKYLSEQGYSTITFETLYDGLKGGGLPSKPIIVTFDDAYIDFYFNAYPILRRFNIHATQFIPTGLVGGSYYLTWGQIKEMQSSGLISFEAHSIHHLNLNSLSDGQILEEINQSKKTLEENLGVPIRFMAYPYGLANERVQNLVKKAGFAGSAGTWASTTQSEGTLFNIPRIRIGGQYSLEDFKRHL